MMGESAPIQRWVQLAGYALIVGAALMVLSPFLVPLAWAAILAFATWRPYERVCRGLGGRAWLAAALMTTLVVLLVVIPAGLLSLALAAEAGRTFADFRLSALTLRALHGLGGERFAVMFQPLGETIRAVMYGTLFTALSQGLLAMLGYWAAGLRAPVLLGALTALLALTPAGAALVYVSASVWLLLDGRLTAGGLLLAWGVVAVSMVDNIIRSWFLRGAVRVPFLLGFFGVLGGITAFGAVGIFLGPIAIALLLALWREWAAAA